MREGNVFSLLTPMGGGSTPARSRWGGGTPARSSSGTSPIRPGWGVPCWGVPCLGYPLSDLAGGYPTLGTPPPPVRPGWGVPHLGYHHETWPGGYPTSGTPTHQTWLGGGVTPLRVTDGVLDALRSVCLLRSRRRTFLFQNIFGNKFLSFVKYNLTV